MLVLPCSSIFLCFLFRLNLLNMNHLGAYFWSWVDPGMGLFFKLKPQKFGHYWEKAKEQNMAPSLSINNNSAWKALCIMHCYYSCKCCWPFFLALEEWAQCENWVYNVAKDVSSETQVRICRLLAMFKTWEREVVCGVETSSVSLWDSLNVPYVVNAWTQTHPPAAIRFLQ